MILSLSESVRTFTGHRSFPHDKLFGENPNRRRMAVRVNTKLRMGRFIAAPLHATLSVGRIATWPTTCSTLSVFVSHIMLKKPKVPASRGIRLQTTRSRDIKPLLGLRDSHVVVSGQLLF